VCGQGVTVTDREDAVADAWRRLADECVKAVHDHHVLIDRLSRAGLLPSPAATALTASTDQLEAEAAELRRRQPDR
jgi:hypothetical protein